MVPILSRPLFVIFLFTYGQLDGSRNTEGGRPWFFRSPPVRLVVALLAVAPVWALSFSHLRLLFVLCPPVEWRSHHSASFDLSPLRRIGRVSHRTFSGICRSGLFYLILLLLFDLTSIGRILFPPPVGSRVSRPPTCPGCSPFASRPISRVPPSPSPIERAVFSPLQRKMVGVLPRATSRHHAAFEVVNLAATAPLLSPLGLSQQVKACSPSLLMLESDVEILTSTPSFLRPPPYRES